MITTLYNQKVFEPGLFFVRSVRYVQGVYEVSHFYPISISIYISIEGYVPL